MIIDMQPEKYGDDILQSIIKNEGQKQQNKIPFFTIAQNLPNVSALFLNLKSKKFASEKSPYTEDKICKLCHRGNLIKVKHFYWFWLKTSFDWKGLFQTSFQVLCVSTTLNPFQHAHRTV